MEQHYPHFEMPETITEKSVEKLNMLDKVYLPTYIMSFSGIIPPTEADAVLNLIINELSESKGKPEELAKKRKYISDLPKLIYSLEENVSFEEITRGLKEVEYSDSDIRNIANLATRACIAVRAGEYEMSVTPNLTPAQIKAIKTLTELVKRQKQDLQPK